MTEVAKLSNAEDRRKRPDLWQTQTALGVINVIERTRAMRDVALITGPSGVGKTTAAIAAAKSADTDEPGGQTFYVSMTKSSETLQTGFLRIASAVGRHLESHVGAHDAFQTLAYPGWQRDTVLLIDEAQYISDGLLHGLRNLWDELVQQHNPIGLVLIGTDDLSNRINGGGKQRGRPFDPLRGRIGACIALEPANADDVASICRHYGLMGAATEKLLLLVARGRGGLHNVRRLISQAERLATDKQKFTFSDLKQAAALAGVAS